MVRAKRSGDQAALPAPPTKERGVVDKKKPGRDQMSPPGYRLHDRLSQGKDRRHASAGPAGDQRAVITTGLSPIFVFNCSASRLAAD